MSVLLQWNMSHMCRFLKITHNNSGEGNFVWFISDVNLLFPLFIISQYRNWKEDYKAMYTTTHKKGDYFCKVRGCGSHGHNIVTFFSAAWLVKKYWERKWDQTCWRLCSDLTWLVWSHAAVKAFIRDVSETIKRHYGWTYRHSQRDMFACFLQSAAQLWVKTGHVLTWRFHFWRVAPNVCNAR